jgi:hypothetical protein
LDVADADAARREEKAAIIMALRYAEPEGLGAVNRALQKGLTASAQRAADSAERLLLTADSRSAATAIDSLVHLCEMQRVAGDYAASEQACCPHLCRVQWGWRGMAGGRSLVLL